MLYINKNKKIFKYGSAMCVINTDVFCCGKMFGKLTIDLDNYNDSNYIYAVEGLNSRLSFYRIYNIDKNTLENIKKIVEEILELEEENNVLNTDKIKKKDEEIGQYLLNKFYYKLSRVDDKEKYFISGKITNVNIKGYKKVTSDYEDIIKIYNKTYSSRYEGCEACTQEDKDKLDKFKKENSDFFLLCKDTKLQKKIKGSDKNSFEDVLEVIDIFKKK